MVKRSFRRKKTSKLFILVLLVLGVSIGYALLSQTLNINGVAGINKNVFDIHWDDTSIVETEGSVEASLPAIVTDPESKKVITFNTELELPGDYYGFTVDAINEGTLPGVVKEVRVGLYEMDGETPLTLPPEMEYSFTHTDGTTIVPGEVLKPTESVNYKFYLGIKREATKIPDVTQIKAKIEVEFGQITQDQYVLTFNPNGGTTSQPSMMIDKGDSIGDLPTADKPSRSFGGWYTGETDGIGVTEDTIPNGDTTYFAHWDEYLPMFDTGKNVNIKFKTLAGDTLNAEHPEYTEDTNITAIRRSTTEPTAENKTDEHIVSAPTSEGPIYAWFDNGTIYWWSGASAEYLNEDSSEMFNNLKNVTTLDTTFNTNKVTNMHAMFGSSNIENLDLTTFDTSKVTNMNSMFATTNIPTLDLSSFDTSKVTDMGTMFAGATATTIDVSSFDTSKVTNMNSMFATTYISTLNLNSFNTSNVTDISYMFAGSKVTSLDLRNFDTSKVTNFSSALTGLTEATSLNISGWDFSSTTSMSRLFFGDSKLETIGLENVDTHTITDMSLLFEGCSSMVSLDLSDFDISNVTNFEYMFSGCGVKDLDISGWNFASVTSTSGMFSGLSNLETINLTDVNTSNITSMSGMFGGCTSLKSLDMSSFDVSNVTSFGIFGGNTALKTVNISGWNFASTTSLSGFFASGLTGLESINLTDVNTSNITDMSGMFSGCSSLKTLDLTSFDTKKVTSMGSMFYNCSSLTTITVSDDFEVDQVTSSGGMFAGDNSLVGGAGTKFDPSHHDKEYAHYDYGDIWPGYFNRGDINIYTITYNPNGGEVEPTTRSIVEGSRIRELPVPTRTGYVFKGWYTGVTDGVKISERTTVYQDVTYYAHWYNEKDITYNSNTGTFDNDATTNAIHYEYKNQNVTKYSHTPNVNDQGVASGTYSNYLDLNDVVTIPGATSLNVEVWYSTENSQYSDWLAIYPKNATPTSSNYSDATISGGKLYGGAMTSKPSDDSYYHKTYTVQGDTVQFYFYSNYSTGYYGYYAVVTGTGYDYDRSQPYQTPTKSSNKFTGWNTKADGTGTTYKTEDEVINAFDSIEDGTTLYAQWLEQCTVTFDANGGILQWYSTQTFDKGSKINYLPQAMHLDGKALDGWYTAIEGGVKVDKDYIVDHTQTLYAHWSGVQAKFDTGPNVNTKFKLLAGNTTSNTYPYTGYPLGDSNITAIKRATTAPDITTLTLDENIVSDPNSGVKIYAWYDNGTIYWWSSADKEYLNEDASYMFANYSNLTDIDTNFDTSLTENMYYMFGDCRALLNIDVSGFNTHKVTNLSFMFYTGSGMKKLDLSNFDTSNCTNMYSVAGYMNSLEELNLSNWDFSKYNPDTSLVNNLTSYNSSIKKLIMNNTILPANLDHFAASISSIEEISLRNADATRATTMRYMFYYDSKLKKVDMHGVTSPNVTNMEYMFNDDANLETLDISSLTTDKVTTMASMFNNCDKLETLDLSNFKTSNVTNFYYMIGSCNNLKEIDMSGFDFSKGNFTSNKMYNIWYGSDNLEKLTLDNAKFPSYMELAFFGMKKLKTFSAKNVDTSNVTDMSYMFENWESIELIDLSDYDTHNVMKMNFMFSYMYKLKTILVGDDFVVDQTQVHYDMFKDSSEIEGGAGTKWDENYVDKTRAHWDGGLDNPGYFQKKGRVSIGFNPNGGKLKFKYKEVKLGDPIGKLPNPKHGTNEFVGWYTGMTDGDKIDSQDYIPPRSMTLYARWKYNITFNANGGEVEESSRIVYSGNALGELPVPTKTGSVFAGWYTLPGEGTRIKDDYIPTDSITLYARWKETKNITFDATSGKFDNDETTNTITYTYGDKATTRYSHTSNIADDGTVNGTYPINLDVNDIVTIEDAPSIDIEVWFSTQGVYYDWLAIYPKGITPNQNNYNEATISNGKLGGGSYSVKPSSTYYHKYYTVTDDTAQFYFHSNDWSNYYGYYAIITGIGKGYVGEGTYKEPTKENYFFSWNTQRDGNGKSYETEQEIIDDLENLDANQTLYAQWRLPGEYTVTFDGNGGNVTEATRQVTERDAVGQFPTSTWNKHVFTGWYDAKVGGNLVDETTVPTKNTTYYAHWKDIYTVTFEANGGTVDPVSVDVVEGEEIGTLPSPIWNKHLFLGWYTELSDGTKVTPTYKPTSNQIIYARWRNIYTITFNANGGTVTEETRDVLDGDMIGELPTPTSENIFENWTSEIGAGTVIEGTHIPDSDMTLYANYLDIPTPKKLEDDDWKTIAWVAENADSCGPYHVGDTKTIDMGSMGTHTVRIVNCSRPKECDSDEYSQTACGMVFEFTDILDLRRMNPRKSGTGIPALGEDNRGGWQYSEVRQYVNNEVYNALPADLRNAIMDTYAVSGFAMYDDYEDDQDQILPRSKYPKYNFYTMDKLYLASYSEVYGPHKRSQYSQDVYDDDTAWQFTRQLDYYKNLPPYNYTTGFFVETIHTNTGKYYNGQLNAWWTRNPRSNTGSCYGLITYEGQINEVFGCTVEHEFGVSPSFRLGRPHGWNLTNSLTPLENQKWEYIISDHQRIKKGWRKLEDFYGNEGWFYFENGFAKTGWHEENGKKYYLSTFDEDGNGYVNCNRLENTTKEINGVNYTFDSEGVCTNCN